MAEIFHKIKAWLYYNVLTKDKPNDLWQLKGEKDICKWEYRDDPREYARRIAPVYATSPDYADTLVAVINDVERYVGRDGIMKKVKEKWSSETISKTGQDLRSRKSRENFFNRLLRKDVKQKYYGKNC
jgi:hypothetical protein